MQTDVCIATCPEHTTQSFQLPGGIPLGRGERRAWKPKATPPLAFLCPTCNAVYSCSPTTFRVERVDKVAPSPSLGEQIVLISTQCERDNCGLPCTTILCASKDSTRKEVLRTLMQAESRAVCQQSHAVAWGTESRYQTVDSLIPYLFETRSRRISYSVGLLG